MTDNTWLHEYLTKLYCLHHYSKHFQNLSSVFSLALCALAIKAQLNPPVSAQQNLAINQRKQVVQPSLRNVKRLDTAESSLKSAGHLPHPRSCELTPQQTHLHVDHWNSAQSTCRPSAHCEVDSWFRYAISRSQKCPCPKAYWLRVTSEQDGARPNHTEQHCSLQYMLTATLLSSSVHLLSKNNSGTQQRAGWSSPVRLLFDFVLWWLLSHQATDFLHAFTNRTVSLQILGLLLSPERQLQLL